MLGGDNLHQTWHFGVNTWLAYYKDEEEDNDKDTCNGGEAKGYAQLLSWSELLVQCLASKGKCVDVKIDVLVCLFG